MSSESFVHNPAITSSFKPLESMPAVVPAQSTVRAVVIGGGTGSQVSVRTLLSMGFETSAVVAMADDGGSTGILRTEAHVTPPGDVRKCIGSFARNQDDPMTIAFKYRFPFADNHTLGNLMLAALEEATGSFARAIEICEDILDAQGHVHPSTLDTVGLSGVTCQDQVLSGQVTLSNSPCALKSVWLTASGECHANEGALQAIRESDVIVLGPGSLFTSIIPNLLVPGIVEAIEDSGSPTIFIGGVADQQGETAGLTAVQHVQALLSHGMLGLLSCALLHSAGPVLPKDVAQAQERQSNGSVRLYREDLQWIESMGIKPVVRNLVNPQQPTLHDPAALRSALREVLGACLSLPM